MTVGAPNAAPKTNRAEPVEAFLHTAPRLLTLVSETTGEFGEVAVELAEHNGVVHADLSVGANVASSGPLQANENLSCPGVKLHGAGFIVTPDEVAAFKLQGSQTIIRDYRNGRDLTGEPRGVKVIDAFGWTAAELRARFPAVYQWLLERVKPEREQNNRATYRDNWWLFGETRRELRLALVNLPRYIATVVTSKHRLFQFLEAEILADDALICIASSDAFDLGVLSSTVHTAWALAQGGTLEDRPRYNKSRCFETFPFPAEDTGLSPTLRKQIAALAEHIDTHRKRQQAAHPGLTLTGMYNVLEALKAERELTAKEKTIHTQGLVSVLKELHDELDTAVLQSYGLAANPGKDALLTHLVALNAQRAQEEKTGLIRWLRPEFQNPAVAKALQNSEHIAPVFSAQQADLALNVPAAGASRPGAQAWPGSLPEQMRAVAQLLASATTALTLGQIEAHFKGKGPWKKGLPRILQTLEALGRARREVDGWRA
ncbi:MAG: hypothetical protein EAZ34_08120 [Polaromonas sp.]|nr:MAG: hypothetical protein EAZ34_08120 [Polaromonas sp.]